MNKKLRKLIKHPKAYFYDFFRKQIRNNPKGPVSIAVRAAFASAKTDLGYGKEIRGYLRDGELNQAEKVCLEGVNISPKAIRPYVLYAEVSMRKGDFDEATRRWKTVVEKFPKKAEGYAGEARAYAALGDFVRVEMLCNSSIKSMPHEFWPYIELAEVSMRKQNFSEAINRWQRVQEKFPDKGVSYVRGSTAYCELKNFTEADKLCKQCMTILPKDIRAYAEYAEVSMRQRNFQDAINRWQKVREKFPKRAVGYVRAATAYCELGNFVEAESLCSKCMEAVPKDIRSFTEYAEISMRQRNFQDAINRWQKVRELFPKRAVGYVRGASAYRELENYEKAESLCKQCMNVIPYDMSSYTEFAEISMNQQVFSEAIKRWQVVRDKFPRKPIGYTRGASACCELNEFSEAERLCRQCMEIVPNDISPFAQYAEISMRKCEYNEASYRWEIVRDKFPNKVNGYIGGGRAYQELHDFEKAEGVCRKGLEILKQNSINCRDLNYLLINITLKQHGKAKNCISLISSIEQTLPETINDRRYYEALVQILFFMLGRDKDAVPNSNTDFILLRLLNEPLNYSRTTIYIKKLLSMMSRYKDIYDLLIGYLDTMIIKNNINSPLAVLASSSSSDEDRVNAHLKIIRGNCYHSVHLCSFQPQNKEMLQRACDIIIENGEYKSLNPYLLFNFARAVIYTNQDKGDQFISVLYETHKGKNLPVSDPIGLLCFNHVQRQKFLKSIRLQAKPENQKLNIAVCVSGQLRGYKGNLDSLVNALGLAQHNYRVFVHTWSNIGRRFPIPVHASRTFSGEFLKTYYECFVNKPNFQEYIKRQYPVFNNLLINSSLANFDVLKKEYRTSDIVIDNEDDEPFSSFNNQEKMHYKIYAAHKLAIDSGEQFDLIIRIRPDLKRESQEKPDLVDIYNKSRTNVSIFTVSGLVSIHWANDYLIDDQFAIGIPETMDIYANTYWDFEKHVKNHTYSRTKKFFGHTTLEHNLFCNAIHVDTIQQKITGPLQDPEMISSKVVYDALCKDVKNRTLTAEDHHLLDACKRDMA